MLLPHQRYRHRLRLVRWPATVLTPQTQIEGQVENVSPLGALISFTEAPPLEWDLRLIIKPSNHQTINVLAKMIWSTVLTTDEGSPRFGVGVEFTRISDGDCQFLAANPG
ncbi:MAG TPA: PilZ domain-containing protein [Syntrophobacteria bacterium]|nr:PilZ domain-containing protein [Syntrophobacteria bacterium]